MESSATFSNTYPVLFPPPHPPFASSQTDSSPFAEANLAVNELIRAMKIKINELQTSAPADLSATAKKSPKIAFSTFRGKPLAMALYKPRRKGGAVAADAVSIRGKKANKSEASKRASSAGLNRKVFTLKLDESRPSDRSLLDDGYDSDTRLE